MITLRSCPWKSSVEPTFTPFAPTNTSAALRARVSFCACLLYGVITPMSAGVIGRPPRTASRSRT